MKCQNCGTENPPEDKYCGACGRYLLDEESQEGGWTKTYGIPGLYESSITDGPSGAWIQTRFSFLGFQETSRYPRGLILLLGWVLVGLMFYLGLAMISEINEVGMGTGVIVLSLLVGYALYRIYYRPPRHRDK